MLLKKSESSLPQIGIFKLFGDNEVILTALLSYLLSIDETFCFEVCKPFIGKAKFEFLNLEISREVVRKENKNKDRTDIEVKQNEDFAIIFEAKIDNFLPSKRQIDAYIERLQEYSAGNKKLVLLVGSAELMNKAIRNYYSENDETKNKIEILEWAQINSIVLNHLKKFRPINRTYFTDFLNFINQDYYMKSYQEEVMIIGINERFRYDENAYEAIRGLTSANAVFEKRLYQASENKLKYVLYLAFRYNGKLSHFAKVGRQEYIGEQNLMIFHLDKILQIPEHLTRKVSYGYRQGIHHSSIQKIFDPELIEFKELLG